MAKVSVIIPSYNGEVTLRDCLNSALTQDYDNYEIIVIDSSTDNSPKIIEKEFSEVKLFHYEKRISWGKGKNIGIQKSKGDYLFFLCIDCVIGNKSISRAVKLFEKDKELKGLGLAIENHPATSVIGRIDFLLEYYHWLPCQKRLDKRFLTTAASFYRREILFNNKFEEFDAHAEDIILTAHLANEGYKLLFEPSIKVKHINIRKNFLSFMKHQLEVGKGAAIARKKTVKSYKIFLKFPAFIFITPLYVVPKMALTYLVRDDFNNFVFFLKYFPLFFIGNFFWAIGFFNEAIKKIK